MLNFRTVADAKSALEKLDGYLAEAGRSPESFGLEPRLPYGDGNPDDWAATVAEWKAAGATHLSFNTMGKGFDAPAVHITAIRKFADAVKP